MMDEDSSYIPPKTSSSLEYVATDDVNDQAAKYAVSDANSDRVAFAARGPQLSFNEVDRVDLAVRGLTVTISQSKPLLQTLGLKKTMAPTPPKKILDNVSVDVPAGTVMAIIGGSGSGKTSLLNVMAHRMKSSKLKVEGQVTFNRQPDLHKIRHAYVLQQDILLPMLTARETLMYSADLRLPSTTTKEERHKLVQEVILELGLKECADTIVGDGAHKGLSGGEKRRLSIGIQLLSNPSVLFLDEPTTGLDAYSALLLVQTLKKLARKGRTLITSIHQPRADIFFLFDSITLLSMGQPVYCGPVKPSLGYFENLGFTFSELMNPADLLIDIAAHDTRSPEARLESDTRIESLVAAWRRTENFKPVELVPAPPNLTDVHAPFLREITVLTKRTVLITVRDHMGLVGSLIEAVFNGIICGWIFYSLDSSTTGIKSQIGAVYTSIATQGYLILMYETYRLSSVDIKVYDRERNEGMISISGFLISRRMARLFLEDVPVPLIYSVIMYFMTGFPAEPKRFFLYFTCVILQHYASITMATFAVSVSRDYSIAVLVGNSFSTAQTMSCGYFLQTHSMPVYVRWIKWVCYQFYGFSAMCATIFYDFFGDCPYGDASTSACASYTGDYQLTSLGIKPGWIGVPLVAVLCLCLATYLGAAAMLYFKPVDVSVAASKTAKESSVAKADATLTVVEPVPESDRLTVDVEDLHLSIEKYSARLKKKRIDILRGISAQFQPGSINAILGPSGSGKSSLLNFVALRLNSSLLSRYIASGAVLLNGQSPSPAVLKAICSYVTQDDDGLLPTLTVRETLNFAADLRLPPTLTKAQRRARVAEVINKMGLAECADTLIGSEFIKGISGGEKRRVSISVQLLNEPKVLLLDEPTSGLDSFTAASILTVLKALADEGRTIVCTIHQPRSDLYSFFHNVLLLAKGGRVAYSGPGGDELLDYFAGCGYPCPPLTNPADHILDMISVNLQDPVSEAETRERVDALLSEFARRRQENQEKSIVGRSSSVRLVKGYDGGQDLGSLGRQSASFARTFPVLCHRTTLDFMRNPAILIGRFGQVVGFGILMALFFSPIKSDYISIQNRVGVVQQFSAMYFVGMLCNIATYPAQRDLFYREHDDGVYGVLCFLVAYALFEVPFEIVNSLIFSCLMVLVTGINRTVGMYFSSAIFCFVIVNCGESIGIAFSTVFHHPGFAVNMISVALSVGTLMSGLMSYNMMGFLKGFSYINPLMYGSKALFNYAFAGRTFTCSDALKVDGVCPLATGDQVIDAYHMRINKGFYLGMLIVTAVYYRVLAMVTVKLFRLQLGLTSGVKSSTTGHRNSLKAASEKSSKVVQKEENVGLEI
ncbi:ABC efflux transporter [Myxozyma melibiosi]|uniref:ABC efflux transporter n=1 Tax=Myxozyma melibiosi TaxID=54550 RepID=A0ABR1FFH4_9ASCO